MKKMNKTDCSLTYVAVTKVYVFISPIPISLQKSSTDRSHFMPGLHSSKTSCKSNTKFPFTKCTSWG